LNQGHHQLAKQLIEPRYTIAMNCGDGLAEGHNIGSTKPATLVED